jgi:hypothetical protein
MRTSLRFAIALLFMLPAWAGDWRSNPELRYELSAPVEQPSKPTTSDLGGIGRQNPETFRCKSSSRVQVREV